MRRSDLLLKIISFTAFLAVAVYIGFYLYNARVNPLRTVLAVRASASESAPAEGYAVREEQLITGSGSGAYVVAGEGQKLSAGGRAAVAYSDRSAAERSARILELQLRLDALNGLLGGMTVSEAASATVTDLACAVRSGDFSDLTELRARTDTYIFGDTITRTSEEIRGEIAAIEEQLADAAGRDTAGASYVTVPAAGADSAVFQAADVPLLRLGRITADGFAEAQGLAEPRLLLRVGGLVRAFLCKRRRARQEEQSPEDRVFVREFGEQRGFVPQGLAFALLG